MTISIWNWIYWRRACVSSWGFGDCAIWSFGLHWASEPFHRRLCHGFSEWLRLWPFPFRIIPFLFLLGGSLPGQGYFDSEDICFKKDRLATLRIQRSVFIEIPYSGTDSLRSTHCGEKTGNQRVFGIWRKLVFENTTRSLRLRNPFHTVLRFSLAP